MPPLRSFVRNTYAILITLALIPSAAVAAPPLASYRIGPDRIFVAGISSGGAMAVQMSIAYSRLFRGAAIYAGLPYYCAQDSEATALTTCQEDAPTPIDLAILEEITRQYATQGLIDPLEYVSRQQVYLWSGTIDVTVRQPAMDDVRTYYGDFGADVFQYDNNFQAAHGWESPYGPNPCNIESSPFIVLCRDSDRTGATGSAIYDSEQVWMTKFFGALSPKNSAALSGSVIPFDQDEFAPGASASAIGMDTTGYAFVPKSCSAGDRCGLILAIHGCNQYYGEIGSQFIDDSGINQWADTNNIVVLYPRTIAMASNPAGCWDWWGYLNDPNYAQKSGPQMQALYQMVHRASGRSD